MSDASTTTEVIDPADGALIPKLRSGALRGKLSGSEVVSRSMRPALGGEVTEVIRHAAGGFEVKVTRTGEEWGTYPTFARALEVARRGPQQ